MSDNKFTVEIEYKDQSEKEMIINIDLLSIIPLFNILNKLNIDINILDQFNIVSYLCEVNNLKSIRSRIIYDLSSNTEYKQDHNEEKIINSINLLLKHELNEDYTIDNTYKSILVKKIIVVKTEGLLRIIIIFTTSQLITKSNKENVKLIAFQINIDEDDFVDCFFVHQPPSKMRFN